MLQNLALLLGLIAVGAGFGLISGHMIWNRSREFATQRRALGDLDRDLRAARTALEAQTKTFEAERLVLFEERKAAEAESEVSELRSTALESALATAREEALKLERYATAARAEKAAAEERLGDEVLSIAAMQSKIDELQKSQSAVADREAKLDAIVDAKVKAQNALADEMAQARRREEEVVALKAELLHALEQTKSQRDTLDSQTAELSAAKTQATRAEQLERDLAAMTEKAAQIPAFKARIEDLEAQMRSVAEASSELDNVLANLAERDKLIGDLRARATPEATAALMRTPTPSNSPVATPRKSRRVPPVQERQPDNLKRIKGVSPAVEAKLHELGIIHFDQMAAWSAEDVARIDAQLETFTSDATRGQWVSQAKILAAGGETPFSARIAEEEVYRSA